MQIDHNFKILEDWKTISWQVLNVDFEWGERWDLDCYDSKDWKFYITSSACPYLFRNYLYVWWDVEVSDNDILKHTCDTKEQAQQILAYINEFNMEKEETFEEWELVEVSDDGVEWECSTFIMNSKITKKGYGIRPVHKDDLLQWNDLYMTPFNYIRKIPKTKEITITVTEEQEEKIKELWIIIK